MREVVENKSDFFCLCHCSKSPFSNHHIKYNATRNGFHFQLHFGHILDMLKPENLPVSILSGNTAHRNALNEIFQLCKYLFLNRFLTNNLI